MKDIAGRHKLSDNLGAARYWTDENGVPMPDRSLSWLRFLSVVGGPFGLDHIYLRSPVTGFLKLITLGGFGLWWLWDTLQVFLEKERVIKYGLTAPFDIPMKILTGVGQGMVTDQPTGYTSSANFPLYILTTLVGFTGLDSLMERDYGLAIRRFIDFVIFAVFARSANTSTAGGIFATIFATVFGFFVLVPYALNLWGLITGYSSDVTYMSLLDWYMQEYNEVGKKISADDDAPSEVSARIQQLYGFTTKNRETIRETFLMYDPPLKPKVDTSREAGPWPRAMFWGSPFGVFFHFISSWIPGWNALVDGSIETTLLKKKKSLIETAVDVAVASVPEASAVRQLTQSGGGDPLSYEAKILGATVGALIIGGGIKGLVDHLITA